MTCKRTFLRRHVTNGVARLLGWVVIMAVTTASTLAASGNNEDARDDWSRATPDFKWSFPRDHAAHETFKNEWWYFTGHLESVGNPERHFGYQFTFFRIALVPHALAQDSNWKSHSLVMAHAAIGDLRAGRHHFSETLYRAAPLLGGFGTDPDSVIAWCRAPAGTDARWQLRWNGDAFDFEMRDDRRGMALSFVTRPEKPLVFQGPNGWSRKGPSDDNASHYISFTRLGTTGRLRLGDETFTVRGTSWMDHEFSSNQLADNQIGWDWFSVQLDDGRDLMLYVLRNHDGGVDYATGTVTSADGSTRFLGATDWSYSPSQEWTSPHTGATYATRWQVRVPAAALDLRLEAIMRDQENCGRRLYYWEGAVRALDASGRSVGRGYVELTGYGNDNRPPL